ncbi:hypothetical protein PVK06_026577 [Gossypium arboreum]|uniref:Uncharacterized protein n=1 Tax=Gossypium arboreum TaxID=29729 RepID=A0ABR0NYL1_GOSAR|nr:hypothetical protein PVK06_026577 [Gossypium arboreum]
MLNGKDNSGFGWDEHKQLVVAEDASHKKVDQFRHHSFLYYDQVVAIYAKDQATRKDAQTTIDIIEEIDAEDVATANTHEERNDLHGCKADVSLDEMDLSATQLRPSRNQDDSTFLKKKKKRFLMQMNIFLMQMNIFLLLHLLILPRYWWKTYRPLALK